MVRSATVATQRGAARRLGFALIAAAGAWALLAPTGAQAATVTIGSPLTAMFAPNVCGAPCTVMSSSLPEPGAMVFSPMKGTIVRWHLLQGSSASKYKLRVLTPVSGTTYSAASTSAAETPTGSGLETFQTNLPIDVGQAIAIDLDGGASIGFNATVGKYIFWASPPVDGTPTLGNETDGELAFNAEVQPPPTVSSVAPSSGSFKGGTGVTIGGSDFADVKSVSFGSTPAQSFGVGSEGQITAISPAATRPRPVNITVTTVAGQSATTPGDRFTYTACVVPKLKRKKIKAARKALKKRGCKLGKVKRRRKAGKNPKVIKQSAKPRALRPPGAKINIVVARSHSKKGKRGPQ